MNRRELVESRNTWDWIGHGIYFWEHSLSRAIEFAQQQSNRKSSRIKTAAAIGAVLDLGICLDLLDYQNLAMLRETYQRLEVGKLPDNRNASGDKSNDLLLRELDCFIIEEFHKHRAQENLQPFDSVRAVFSEGKLLYPNAGFRDKNHIQICVRNPSCIKGLFIPRFN